MRTNLSNINQQSFFCLKFKDLFFSLLSVFIVAVFPSFFMLFNNIERTNFSDIVSIASIFMLIGTISLLLFYLLFKDIYKAALLTNLSLFLFSNFALLESAIIKIIPMLHYWHILMIMISIIVLVAISVKNKLSTEFANNLSVVLLIVFSGLILFNAIKAIPEIIKKNTKETGSSQFEIQQGTITSHNNVYFFVFDEYGGYDNLLRYTGFDNSAFYEALEILVLMSLAQQKLFNRHIYRTSNLLNLSFVNNGKMSHDTKKLALDSPVLFQLFKENGYSLNVVSDYGHIPIENTEVSVDYAYVSGKYEDTLKVLILNNSVYYPFLSNQYRNTRIVEVENMFQYLTNSWKLQPLKLFTFSYISFPHLPWVVDEFGNNISLSNKQNWQNSDVYLNQLKYCSKKIMGVVTNIIKNDPDAIVIIQSDHGYRQAYYLKNWYGETYDDWGLEMQYIRNILNAVYYKGEKIDIENYSGVNTLIIVLNEHFGMNYELLEQPK